MILLRAGKAYIDNIGYIDYCQYMKFNSACSGCFAGLSCGVRVEIINLLQKNGKMQVTEIAKNFQLKQPTISHHLKYLREMGIVASNKIGRKIYYYIHPKCAKECGVFI